MASFVPPGIGWQRDLPDHRDYGPDHSLLRSLLTPLGRRRAIAAGRGAAVHWQEYFSQADSSDCAASAAARACAAMVEYYERRIHGKSVNGSSVFLSQMAGRLAWGSWGAPGASLRTTLKALRRFGMPPGSLWPEAGDRPDEEPPPFLFSYAREYQSMAYFRLDQLGPAHHKTLEVVKSFLAAGLPVAFGFSVCDLLSADPDVAFPTCFDTAVGGQVVVALGYDNNRRIRSEKGALRIRGAWGREWGEAGYGWLPYRYVTGALAADFWTILRPDWAESGELSALE